MKSVADMLEEYDELSKSIRAMEEAKQAVKAAIFSKMRETGENVDVIEAGGYRASIAYREYLSFDPGEDSASAKARVTLLGEMFKKVAPLEYVPASDRINKMWTAWVDAHPDGATMPEFLKKSQTPVLRVSGARATTQE